MIENTAGEKILKFFAIAARQKYVSRFRSSLSFTDIDKVLILIFVKFFKKWEKYFLKITKEESLTKYYIKKPSTLGRWGRGCIMQISYELRNRKFCLF